jgi:hypothetical protein
METCRKSRGHRKLIVWQRAVGMLTRLAKAVAPAESTKKK